MEDSNPNIYLINIYIHLQNSVKFYPFVLKILGRNKILTSIKGYNSVTNKQNMEDSNPNIYLINIYTFTKFGGILSICPQDIGQKQNSVANQGPLLCYKFVKDSR